MGQNKSQVVMQFFCMLQLLFYPDGLMLHYLAAGHGKMACDRVVAVCRQTMRKKSLGNSVTSSIYVPDQLVSLFEGIKNLSTEFIDHRSSQRQMYDGFGSLFEQAGFRRFPDKVTYTRYHCFEFKDGVVTCNYEWKINIEKPIKEPLDLVEVEAPYCHVMLDPTRIEACKRLLIEKIWGEKNASNLASVSVDKLQKIKLQKTELIQLPAAKLNSLYQITEHIPTKFLDYYPLVGDLFKAHTDDVLASVSPKEAPARSLLLQNDLYAKLASAERLSSALDTVDKQLPKRSQGRKDTVKLKGTLKAGHLISVSPDSLLAKPVAPLFKGDLNRIANDSEVIKNATSMGLMATTDSTKRSHLVFSSPNNSSATESKIQSVVDGLGFPGQGNSIVDDDLKIDDPFEEGMF